MRKETTRWPFFKKKMTIICRRNRFAKDEFGFFSTKPIVLQKRHVNPQRSERWSFIARQTHTEHIHSCFKNAFLKRPSCCLFPHMRYYYKAQLREMACQNMLYVLLMRKCRVLHSVAECCSVLQCAAVCCSMVHCGALWCNVVQCGTVCCRVLQCVAVCCSVLQCFAVCCSLQQIH